MHVVQETTFHSVFYLEPPHVKDDLEKSEHREEVIHSMALVSLFRVQELLAIYSGQQVHVHSKSHHLISFRSKSSGPDTGIP